MNISLIVDLHTHTYLCKHSETINPTAYMELYHEAGIRKAFCCHTPFPGDSYDFRNRMRYSELPLFFKYYEASCARALQLGDPKPLLTMEVDWNVYEPERTENIINLLEQQYKFDYFIGSLHYNDLRERRPCLLEDVDSFIEEYCEHLTQMIESGLFEVIAHADFFKNFHLPSLEFYRKSEENARYIDDKVIAAILKGYESNKNIIIEINTSAKKKRNYLDFFPSKYIIKKLAENDVKFGISSDAHYIIDVGQEFDICALYLMEIGVKELHYFEEFELHSYKIADVIGNLHVKFRATQELDEIREEYEI